MNDWIFRELLDHHRRLARPALYRELRVPGSAPVPVHSDETRFHERAAELLAALEPFVSMHLATSNHVDLYELQAALAIKRLAARIDNSLRDRG